MPKVDGQLRGSEYPCLSSEAEKRGQGLLVQPAGESALGTKVVGRTQEIFVNNISCGKHGEHAFPIPVCLSHTWSQES